MKIFKKVYIPDANGMYVESDVQGFTGQTQSFYNTGNRIILSLSSYEETDSEIMDNLYEAGLNPIRMKAVWKLNI